MLKGTLEEFALADIFRLISWAKKTGKLEVVRSAGHGKIFFRDGEVYYAQSSISREPLGQKLIRSGALTETQLMKALDQNAQTGERVGRILVASGWVDDTQLEAALRQQIEDAVFDLLRWELGEFTYESSVEADIEVQISVSVENLIIEASRRLDELEVIQRKIPSEGAIVKMSNRPPEGAAEINITPEEWRMLVLVDGVRSVHEIAKLVGMDDFGALRGLYGLVSAGLVEVVTTEHQPSTTGVPVQAFTDQERGALEPKPQASAPAEPPPVAIEEPPAAAVVAEPPAPADAPPAVSETLAPEHLAPETAPEPAPVEEQDQGSGSAFKQDDSGWDQATMSSVFHVEEEPSADAPVPSAEAFDAPGPEDLVESKPDPFLNDLLGGEAASPETEATPEAPQPEATQPEPSQGPPSATGGNPAPPAPSKATPQVDRTTVVRELAGLFTDDDVPSRPTTEAQGENGDSRKRVEDDDELNKGLITRLIDGVKGL